MKTANLLSLLVIGLCVTTGLAAETPSEPRLLDFISSQHTRQYSGVPYEVLAFYYTGYGTPERHGKWIHWGGEDKTAHDIPESRHYPARGAYNSQDPELLEAHILQAKFSGLTGFITTWWGRAPTKIARFNSCSIRRTSTISKRPFTGKPRREKAANKSRTPSTIWFM